MLAMTITTHNYQTLTSSDVVFKRLRMDITETDHLVNSSYGNVTIDTTRPWVGQVNELAGTFKGVQTNPSAFLFRFLEGNFFTIFIHGRVFSQENSTRIQVKYKLAGTTTFRLVAYCFFSIFMAIMSIVDENGPA